MDHLRVHPTSLTTDQIKTICQRHSLPYINHQRIYRGFVNGVYRLNHDLVFKFYGSERLHKQRIEQAVLGLDINIPKAQLVAAGVDPTSQQPYLIMSFIPGRSLDSCWHLANEQQREALIVHICRILQTLRQVDVQLLGLPTSLSWKQTIANQIQDHLKNLNDQGQLTPNLLQRAQAVSAHGLEFLDNPQPDQRFCCFWDIHFGNFIVDDQFRLQGVVDLEGVSWAPLDYPVRIIETMMSNPSLYLVPEEKQWANKAHYQHLRAWYQQYDPDMFKHPYLSQRTNLYQLATRLADLKFNPGDPHVLKQIETYLSAPIGQ